MAAVDVSRLSPLAVVALRADDDDGDDDSDDDDDDDDDVVRRKGCYSWDPQNNGPPRGVVRRRETAKDCASAKLKGTRE